MTTQTPPHEQETPTADAAPERAGGFPRGALAMILILAVPFAMFAGFLAWFAARPGPAEFGPVDRKELPVLGEIPDFELTDRTGRRLDKAALADRIWVADFIFTRCAGPCPAMTANMRKIQESLEGMSQIWPPPSLVSFTVDPNYDTVPVLRRYAENYGADPERWHFLTGPYEEIQTLAREGLYLEVQPADRETGQPIIHSQRMVLIDGEGRVRGYYDGTEPAEVHRLLADLVKLDRKG